MTINNRVTLLIFSLTLVFNQVFGQTFKQQFNEFVSKKDTLGQQQLLDKWEKSDNNDPEPYIAYFNYFVKKSVKEVVTLGQNPEGNDVLLIMDKDSSKKRTCCLPIW